MTFDKALEVKSTLPEYERIQSSGYLAKFYVVPENSSDLMEWLKNFNPSITTDDVAKKYSSYNRYTLYLKAIAN